MASLRRIVIIGAGGHGAVVADAAEASQAWSEIEFLDDSFPQRREIAHWKIVGNVASLQELGGAAAAVVAIGDNRQRMNLLDRIADAKVPLATVIHPTACVSKLASIGPGTVLLANAVVNARTAVGKGCIINTAATVDHDCELADGVHVAPGAHLAADIVVGERTLIGVGGSARPQVRIGADVVVGAGSAVVGNVHDGAVVAGVPARPLGQESHTRVPGRQMNTDGESNG